jgi:hypothetical protein
MPILGLYLLFQGVQFTFLGNVVCSDASRKKGGKKENQYEFDQ